jgi:hypothetical protein
MFYHQILRENTIYHKVSAKEVSTKIYYEAFCVKFCHIEFTTRIHTELYVYSISYQDVPDEPSKVISTKLTAQEHDALFEECNKRGCTMTQFLREACLRAMDIKPEPSIPQNISQNTQKENKNKENAFDLQEKISKLEAQLAKANSTISTQRQTIREFDRFVPQSELNRRKFGEIIHKP